MSSTNEHHSNIVAFDALVAYVHRPAQALDVAQHWVNMRANL